MKISVGSDERTPTTDAVVEELRKRGIDVELYGPLSDQAKQWAEVAEDVARDVADGRAERGILFCWTGTGCSMAANKVPGVRAALCTDAETARGARRWNDANVLSMSLRLATPILAREIVGAFLDTGDVDPSEIPNIQRLGKLEAR
ncbi:MAG TPA: RpiB/LacA/LacB family sugar-phosphate isomerase [Actinomycetota bacterium]|nr:RpiB/LacA/LacB family sugar-phosphate isomerase [Actinomycetota bacterium]